jgi:hypothetical protein
MTNTPSRRAVLTALPAAAIGIGALWPAAAAGADRDAELIRLGAEFDRIYAEYLPLYEEVGRLGGIFEDAVDELELNIGGKADFAVWRHLRIETGYEGAIIAAEAVGCRIDPLANRVFEIPAASIAGLAVKARYAQFYNHSIDKIKVPARDQDYDVFVLCELVRDIQRLASTALAIGGANA